MTASFLRPMAWLLPASLASAGELRVAAASSLDEAVGELATRYEQSTGTRVRTVLAGSNTLARQIEQGVRVDVFLSADRRTMEGLEAGGLVRDVRPLLTNRLVVVVPRGSRRELRQPSDLLRLRRIAVGDPAGVPAGVYARRWLEGIGLWHDLEPRCVGCEHVRAALAAVAARSVDAAIVYRTDALASERVRVAFEVPAGVGPEIVYPVALGTRASAGARAFLGFLQGEPAAEVFRGHGFGIAARPSRPVGDTPPPTRRDAGWLRGDLRLMFFTIGAAALAVVLSLPLALGVGWCLARRRWWGKSLVETLVLLPLVVPPVVTGLALLLLFGPEGPLGGPLGRFLGIEVVFTWKAVVIAMGVMSFPLLVGSVRSAFEEIPPHLESAARTLGTSPWHVFLRVTLPLARRGIGSGVLLGFSRALGEFGATVMVAGFIPGVTETLPLAIYRGVQTGDDRRAWILAAVAVVISATCVALVQKHRQRALAGWR